MQIEHITSWIRIVSHGNSLDGYKDVEVKTLDGNWQLSKRFEESDDYMATSLAAHIDFLRSNSHGHR